MMGYPFKGYVEIKYPLSESNLNFFNSLKEQILKYQDYNLGVGIENIKKKRNKGFLKYFRKRLNNEELLELFYKTGGWFGGSYIHPYMSELKNIEYLLNLHSNGDEFSVYLSVDDMKNMKNFLNFAINGEYDKV